MIGTALTRGEEETEALGYALGRRLFAGAVLLVEGDPGAGKTVLARGVGRGLEVRTAVVSPTFTILHVHDGRLPFYHFDLYRLRDEEELWDLGAEEYLAGDGVCLVEWAGRFPAFFAGPALRITLETAGDSCRRIVLAAGSKEYDALILALLPEGDKDDCSGD